MTYEPVTDRGDGLRLHLNENTGGCSPAVLEALRRLTAEEIAVYPDYREVTAAAERWFGVAPGWVQLTNGLDEGIQVVAQHARLVGEGPGPFEAIIPEPAFEMAAAMTEAAGGRMVRIPPALDFQFPLDPILRAVTSRTRVVFLTDPNNPTGVGIPAGAVEEIARTLPDVMIFLDEAYADFSGRTLIGSLNRHRNLVIGRTFAKGHGLAALRIGALVAHPDTLAPVRAILPPYSLNVAAIHALIAALADRAYLDAYVDQTRESRKLIYEFATARGLTCWQSETNFVLVRVGNRATALVEALADRGIFIRDRSKQPGCAGCVRITAGIVEHTRICLHALEELL